MRGLKVAILTAATAWAFPAMAGDDAFKQAVITFSPETSTARPLNW